MTITIPDSVVARGKFSAQLIATLTTPGAPKLSEMTAAQEMTCFFPEDWEGVSADQNVNTQTRMCIAEEWDVLGNVKRSISDVTYTYLPQGLISLAGNKLYSLLVPGSSMYVMLKYGIAPGTANAIGDKYDVIGITVGARSKKPTGTDESAPLVVTQKLALNRALGYYEDVAMVA
ncbi:MAG: hypothetical protein JWO46_1805 [Nocardioidaceae bacterium]|nr:hypothetical protein [Nocardioidaceae bacterium]